MDWNKINSLMPEVVKCVREEYIVNNTIIKVEIPPKQRAVYGTPA